MRHSSTAGLVLICVLLLGVAQSAEAGLRVTPNKENVVASRLEGRWVADAVLTNRLIGGDDPAPRNDEYEFADDPKVAEKLPAKYEAFLKDKPIYMAGTMQRRGREYPFILIEHGGNPHLVWFRERQGDPLGDAESSNVMLAPAKDRSKDLLFVGGDFNNQPFRAYRRKPSADVPSLPGDAAKPPGDGGQAAPAQIPEQAQPLVALLKAVQAGDADGLPPCYSKRMREKLSQGGWPKVLEEYRTGFRQRFGDYKFTEFVFAFEGDERSGRLLVTHQGRKLPGLQVVKEQGTWRIDER